MPSSFVKRVSSMRKEEGKGRSQKEDKRSHRQEEEGEEEQQSKLPDCFYFTGIDRARGSTPSLSLF
ncbi:hypothetical protein Taro_020446 [Colocasia esculenta]|uniref:Uncharacterized protein n=1 Tax=Colocasia esculenta TaxID=4460 RepID=A0A843UYS8_COLES|nr:hypothetical protein [Colocasia esculenta]